MTNSQTASHKSWLVRCSSRTQVFSPKQSVSIPLILQDSAVATCTQPRYHPPPSFLHANFVAVRKNIFDSLGNGTRASASGRSTSQPPCTMLHINVMLQISQIFSCHNHSAILTLDILPFPFAAQDIFLWPTTPRYLAEFIH